MPINKPSEKIKEHYLDEKSTVAEKIVRGLVDGGLVVAGIVPDPIVSHSAVVVKALIDRFTSRSSTETL